MDNDEDNEYAPQSLEECMPDAYNFATNFRKRYARLPTGEMAGRRCRWQIPNRSHVQCPLEAHTETYRIAAALETDFLDAEIPKGYQ